MRSTIKLTLLLGLTTTVSQLHAQTIANAALVSDYLFRGISQTDENPAVQGGVDWSNESGFYLGTWLSNTDFNPPGDESSGVEVDLYGGYSHALGDAALTLGFISYQYPSINAHIEEAVLGFNYGDFEAIYYHDWDNDTNYLSSGYSWTLAREITLGVAGGAFEADRGSDYLHYQVSVSKLFHDLDWSITVSNTDIDRDDVTVLIGISTEFTF